MLEVVVVIAIIGLLLALMLPATQSARETARRMACASNLRQLGIAINNYESQYGVYPLGWTHKYQLLPFIEQTAIFQIPLNTASAYDQWAPIEHFLIPIFLCPTDPAPSQYAALGRSWSTTSYAACSGTGVQRDGFNGMFNLGFTYQNRFPGGFVRPADVLDGLSNTVAMAEILHSNREMERLRVIWQTPNPLGGPNELELFANVCAGIPPEPVAYGWTGAPMNRGIPWYNGDSGKGMYNHILGPNRPSCTNAGAVQFGAYTAASMHTGGVNVLFGDGHVAFASNHVDIGVWREMGSRIKRNVSN